MITTRTVLTLLQSAINAYICACLSNILCTYDSHVWWPKMRFRRPLYVLQRKRTWTTICRLSPHFLHGELIKYNVGVEWYHTTVFEGAEYELISEFLHPGSPGKAEEISPLHWH